MITRINFTARVDIDESLINTNVEVEDGHQELYVSWHLAALMLNPSSYVFLEIFDTKSTRTKRVDLGVLAEGNSTIKYNVDYFPNLSSIRLRFKVVSKENSGRNRIIASIDRLIPTLPPEISSGFSMLAIEESESLKTPWELRFESGEPVLWISGQKNLYNQLRNTSTAPWFMPTIMHDIARQIFLWLCKPSEMNTTNIVKQWQDIFIELGSTREFFVNIDKLEGDSNTTEVLNELKIVLGNFGNKHNLNLELSNLSKISEGQ
jgi:hypothetical protein